MDDGLNTSIRMPEIMGILNVTPDSFSDGGIYDGVEVAIQRGLTLWEEGASWVDVGGESTRPGAAPVTIEEELRRVIPVVKGLKAECTDIRISVDTSKTIVAQHAIEAGAGMINDVRAAADAGLAEVCASTGVRLALMHMRGSPLTMQTATQYHDLVEEVLDFLRQRIEFVQGCGMRIEHLIVDPGLGFGKALMDNFQLIQAIPRFVSLGAPVLIGASRKRFIGHVNQEPVAHQRLAGSIGAALAATQMGAQYLRVHDVKATRHALDVYVRAVE